MKFNFKPLSKDNFDDFNILFQEVFAYNKELNLIDLKKKIEGSSIPFLGIVAYDELDNLAGAIGLYAVHYWKSAKEKGIAAQVGDAMVKKRFRGNDLMAQMTLHLLTEARKYNIDIIFTFPSIENKGSYKAFIKNGFKELSSMHTYTLKSSPNLIPRILRRLSDNLFKKYTEILSDSPYKSEYMNADCSICRSIEYLNYKGFNNNYFLKLKSGFAWVSATKFHLKVGDFYLSEGFLIDDLIDDIKKYSNALAKDFIQFSTNIKAEIDQLKMVNFDDENEKIRLMVYFLKQNSIEKEFFSVNYSDIDVF